MRFPLALASAALFGLLLTGCDSVGPDDAVPCATCTPDGSNDGGSTDGSTDGGTDGGTPTDDGSDATTFLSVDPRQTYTRTSQDAALDAPALRLADYGVAPGQTVCARAVGDFYLEPGVLASASGYPLVTAIFSADDVLLAADQRARVAGAVDTDADVATLETRYGQLATDVAEDFDATGGCVTVPAGAQYVFLAAYDGYYADNEDALVDGQAFGLAIE